MKKTFREQAHELFIQAMNQLASYKNPYEPIPAILADACDFFGFGCGFVYETDHAGAFYLREHHTKHLDSPLRESLTPGTDFSKQDLLYLQQERIVFLSHNSQSSDSPLYSLGNILGVNTMLILPIEDSNNAVVGIIGMVDRRSDILLEEDEINVASSVLSVLANQIKLRVYQQQVDRARQSLESILDNIGIDVYVNDFASHEILYANKSMAAPYGGWENMKNNTCYQALYPDKTHECDYCPQKKLIDENGNPTKIYSWDYRRPFDGSWFRVLSAAFPWVDGRLAHVVSSVDITENKRNEEIIRQMAEYDTLTGLPNRRKFIDDCDNAISRITENNLQGYLLFFDLDNFKEVNDTFGHSAGDDLLTTVGSFLLESPLTKNHCYRHSGDEFVLLYETQSLEAIQAVIASLLDRFSCPWQLRDGAPVCHASIGVARFPHDGQSSDELLRNADLAMYEAKRSGKGVVRYYNQGEIGITPNYPSNSC